MRTTRALATALAAAVALGACSTFTSTSPDSTTVPPTTLPPTTTTTLSPAVLKAALLTPADVPGSKASASPSTGSTDLSTCFPGNPLGAKTDPKEVDSPDLDLIQRPVDRTYSSAARTGTTEQAAAFVATLATPTGSSCALDAFKKDIAADPTAPGGNASGITATSAAAAIADGGAVLRLKGPVVYAKGSVNIEIEAVAFHKGPIVVFLSAAAIGGAVVPGEGVALAQKVAGRLP